jgi:hypothetical protein
MLFIKSGTLREALGLVRDEKMWDGQDPLVIMNGCSEARLNAPVIVEIELSGEKSVPPPLPSTQGASTSALLTEEKAWPVLLKMYVSVQTPPFRRAHEQKEWYVFARRIRREQSFSGLLARMSEKRLNFVMHVR